MAKLILTSHWLVRIKKKITMKIVIGRLSKIIHDNNVLKGFNYGSTPGRSTQDAVNAVKMIMDDAELHKRFLTIIYKEFYIAPIFDQAPSFHCMKTIVDFSKVTKGRFIQRSLPWSLPLIS